MRDKNDGCLLKEIFYEIESVSGKISDFLNNIDPEKQMDELFEFRTKSMLAEFLKD